ncbi:Vacuolar calcium ion transporter [Fusarium oxysporum f. sp. albedinis]|nr:Vacuolar calcium ion transporter [Fusarium oxysporum f. sp. albedinis]
MLKCLIGDRPDGVTRSRSHDSKISSERVNPLLELFLWVTCLIPGELPYAGSIRSKGISSDKQNNRDFYAFKSAILAISGAYKNIDLKSKNSDIKFCKTLEEQLRPFSDRLPNPDKTNKHGSPSTSNNYNDPIKKVHRYSDLILTTGSFDPKIANDLLLNPSKVFIRPVNTECIDLPLEDLFDHLVNGICRNQDHEAFLKLSGWKDIQDKSVFYMFLSTCNTVEGHGTSQCYTTCTLESLDSTGHEGDLSICKEIEDTQLIRIPLRLSFNSTVLIDIFKGETKQLDYRLNLKAWYNALADEAEVILKDNIIKDYQNALYSFLQLSRPCHQDATHKATTYQPISAIFILFSNKDNKNKENIHSYRIYIARLILYYTLECKAGEHTNIINLSFSLRQLYPSPRLNKVLNRLILNCKLIFTATSNSGGNKSRPWLASHPGVFCIHTTNQRGNTNRDINPTAQYSKDNFATLSKNIKSYWNGEKRYISGTSFATLIAAAMAANILEFAQRNLSADKAHNL